MSELKTKAPMYVQQMAKLPFKIDALETRVKTLKPKRYGIIVHDKDVDDEGNLKEPHVHVMMEFDTAQRISALANKLNDLEQNFESMTKVNRKNGANNGFAYLTHRTSNSANDHQYDFSEVRANFDYPEFMRKLSKKVNSRSEPDRLIQDFVDGKLTFIETKRDLLALSPRIYSSKARELREINAAIQDVNAEKWREEMREKGKQIRVIWLYGAAGTGKTRFAETMAGKFTDSNACFTTGGSNDVFSGYQGEKNVSN